MEVTLFTGKRVGRFLPKMEVAGQTRVAVSIPEKAEQESDSTPVSLGEITLESFLGLAAIS